MSGHPPDDAEPFTLQRLGVVMESEPGAAEEAWGVLNPAAARGPDGALYLFPRLVAERNYSRIGLARVRFDACGIPTGVERLGIVLEPQEPYELNPLTGGGVEDARITVVQPLHRYVMAYTALGPQGPRVALATSTDLWHWDRLGLVRFAPEAGLDVNAYPNKDASFFPECVVDPHGQPALALLHRPTVPALPAPSARDTPRQSAASDPRMFERLNGDDVIVGNVCTRFVNMLTIDENASRHDQRLRFRTRIGETALHDGDVEALLMRHRPSPGLRPPSPRFAGRGAMVVRCPSPHVRGRRCAKRG